MPLTNQTQQRLNELLSDSVKAWLDLSSWPSFSSHWRGMGNLLDFAKKLPSPPQPQIADVFPQCLVIAEYARIAVSSDGTDDSLSILTECAGEILAGPTVGSHGVVMNTLIRLVRAITHTVCAAVAFRGHDNESVCEHLQQAAEYYDRTIALTSLRTAQAPLKPVSPDMANVDVSTGDEAWHALKIAQQCGAFGTSGVTISTWLTLHRLLGRVLGVQESEPLSQNEVKTLLVNGPRGVILPVLFSKEESATGGVYFDPCAFGATPILRSMRDSLTVGWRCWRQCEGFSNSTVIRISADMPELSGSLSGGSAGGLFAAATIATAREQQLDSNRSATCQLVINAIDVAEDEPQPLRLENLSLRSVGGVVRKINEAWQVQHGIDEVLLCPTDVAAWQAANPNCTRPKVTPVSSLHELIEKLSGNRRYDREIERHSRMLHGEWERIKAAIRDDNSSDVDRDHRFDCYVDPTFRVEGPVRNLQKNNGEEPAELDRVRATGTEREEFAVPGDNENDQQLLNLLELGIAGKPWPDAPLWLKPARSLVFYDVAGAGKTVCSHRLVNLLTNPEHFKRLFGRPAAPLVIRLDGSWRREYVTRGRLLTVSEMLVEHLVEHMTGKDSSDYALARSVVTHALREKRVVLILDGFDQFLDEDRQHVIEVFHRHPDARGCHWIITSRVHTIDELRSGKRFFADAEWIRTRLDPFSEDQQDVYFHKVDANGRQIGDRWQSMVDRTAMKDLLGLPMVLAMIRVLIDDADRNQLQLPVFYSLSQLYLVTSRKLLARALEKNQKEVDRRLRDKNLPIPSLKVPEQLELLEHVLTLMAFQLMLMEEYNGRVEGTDRVQRFEGLCRERLLFELRMKFQKADDFDKDDIRKKRDRKLVEWDWALEVLRTIEFSHRSVTEAYNEQGLAFRSRKMLECHAARYLTRYATAWDIVAAENPGDMPVVDPENEEQDLSQLCAWNYTTSSQWKEMWELAIEMPHEPISATDHDGVIEHAVIDHQTTCRSLSILFRQPKAYPGRDIRPTELIFRCWHLFEYDERLLRERRFSCEGRLISGKELVAQFGVEELERRGRRLLLGEITGKRSVCQMRDDLLAKFRQSQLGDDLRSALRERKDTVLQKNGQRVPIPYDAKKSSQVLSEWQVQSSTEKSLTLLQCPPPSWLQAFEKASSHLQTTIPDPRINSAIKGQEAEVLKPVSIQATTVTRAMYRAFDPAFETTQAVDWNKDPIAGEIEERASAFGSHKNDDEFPVICTHWFDAWVFCKWLGTKYRLPTEFEWEHACRAGTTTAYHFGQGQNGTQANCDGNHPHGVDEHGKTLSKGPYLRRTTPVGLADYPCNGFGLFDVHGNVWEWCENRRNEENDTPGSSRVLRGGSWYDFADYCKSGHRGGYTPGSRNDLIGFRLCME